MLRILVISSHVAQDTVGLAPTIAPLQHAGIEVVTLPTVVLSNHPARAVCAGTVLEPAVLEKMTAAMDTNGWLGTFDAVLSGYLPSPGHVAWIARLVERMRSLNPGVLYVCDPILGDDPEGLYIDAAAAVAVRDKLLPIADVLTPNRFELSWLAGIEVRSVDDATRAASALARPIIAATSIPAGPAELANVLLNNGTTHVGKVEKLPDVPHGTGDLFAGFLTARLMRGASVTDAWNHAIHGVSYGLEASRGSDRLLLPLIDWTWLSS
ncbi:MAG TPA: pyridoxal kinase [Hyphomicrobium sp.]|jgi:pyridoxine kinase